MIPRDLVKRIRRIQIHTAHVVDQLLVGGWHSAFKGRGIEFEEVRPYTAGDDVRTIDWNVTARAGEPFVKLFREERELAVMLLVDLSASLSVGTQYQTKRDLVSELCATLAFSAIKNNDKVGLTLFTEGIEKHIPPRKGARHVLRLIREILFCQPIGRGTDLAVALQHLSRTTSRRSVVFLVSDFLSGGYETALRVACRNHDVIPMVISDLREAEMPGVGLLRLRDAETGQIMLLDTASSRCRDAYHQQYQQHAEQLAGLFRRLRLDPIYLQTGRDFIDPLKQFFRRRELRR